MSLLPIIYTSLLITGAFLLVVLAISYISYKVKNNGTDNLPASFNHEPKLSLAVAYPNQHKPIAMPKARPNIVRDESSKRKFVDKAASQVVTSNRRQLNHHSENRPRRESHTRMTYMTVAHDIHNTHMDRKPDYMQRTSAGIFRSRIEVLNTQTSEMKTSNQPVANNKIDLQKNDVLNYYTDEDESGFYALKSVGYAH